MEFDRFLYLTRLYGHPTTAYVPPCPLLRSKMAAELVINECKITSQTTDYIGPLPCMLRLVKAHLNCHNDIVANIEMIVNNKIKSLIHTCGDDTPGHANNCVMNYVHRAWCRSTWAVQTLIHLLQCE
jgi:hypothetical protein